MEKLYQEKQEKLKREKLEELRRKMRFAAISAANQQGEEAYHRAREREDMFRNDYLSQRQEQYYHKIKTNSIFLEDVGKENTPNNSQKQIFSIEIFGKFCRV
jgi:hypothetical protein